LLRSRTSAKSEIQPPREQPTLRALSARAPYFHNGIASTIEDVVRHYERRLGFVFTDEERADLVAFLKAL